MTPPQLQADAAPAASRTEILGSGAAVARRSRLRRTIGPWGNWLFAVPLLILLVSFVGIPIGRMVWYSLTDYDGLTSPRYVGLKNFRFLLDDQDFRRIVLNNIILVAGIAVWVVLPFLLAVVLHGLKRANLVRTIIFIPVLMSPVVIGNAFRLVLADGGPLNSALRSIGLSALAAPWLTSESWVLVSVVIVIAWAVLGTGVMLYSAGLAAIPREQIEAATIDGASWASLVWFIYRPALRPVTRFYVLLLTVTTVTGFFPWIFGLTNGGPGNSSTTLDFDVYRTGVVSGVWGRASAIAVCSIVLLIVLVGLQAGASWLRGRLGGRVSLRLPLPPRQVAKSPVTKSRLRRRLGSELLGRRVVALVAVLVIALPILWVVRLAVKPPADYIGAPGSLGGGWTLHNFSDAWTVGHLGHGLLNSVLIVPLGAALATVVGALAAFAIAKLAAPGLRFLLPVIVVAVAVPLTAIVIPLFDQSLAVGYDDSRIGVSLMYGGVFAAWGCLFMYSFFRGIPDELIDSARVDGASSWQIFHRIGLPLGLPAIVTVFIIDLIIQWNDLILALVNLPDQSKQTVTVAIATFTGQFRSGGPLTAAGVLIAAVPVIVIYFGSQRFIRSEMFSGAVKG